MDYFDANAIQVGFEEDNTASFIGVASSSTYRVTYFGTDVFDTVASKVFDSITLREKSGKDSFSSYEYLFPEQIVTLWDADEQYDRLSGEQRQIWATVGVGDSRYLVAVRALEDDDQCQIRPPIRLDFRLSGSRLESWTLRCWRDRRRNGTWVKITIRSTTVTGRSSGFWPSIGP